MKLKKKIAVVGLGYVGLPLLLLISKKYETFGFDLSSEKINLLKKIHHTYLIFQPIN